MNEKKKIVKHLGEDIKRDERVKKSAKSKSYKKALSKDIKHDKKVKKIIAKQPAKKVAKREKVKKVMHEYKEGTLHSGSKKGPRVTNRKQAIAIALSEARRGKK